MRGHAVTPLYRIVALDHRGRELSFPWGRPCTMPADALTSEDASKLRAHFEDYDVINIDIQAVGIPRWVREAMAEEAMRTLERARGLQG